MRYFRAFFTLIFLCLPISVFSSEVKEYKLKNGLKVIILEEPKAPVATFQVWYRVGAKNEPAGKSGLSHLLEHMMFKGTAKYGPSVLSKIVQKNGGTDNAYTTKDHTVYFELFSSDRITIALDLETDRMQNLTLDKDEVISEKNVVMEERRLRYEDDPQSSLFEEVVAAAFKVHPYQRPVIGWMSDLRSIERDDLYNYYRNNYSPNNALIVIVGDVNAEKMIDDIRKTFEGIPPVTQQTSSASLEPEQKGERRIFLKREAELPFILSAYHTPSFPHEDSFALEVLSYILSGGKSARLYQSLVYEQKIALNAAADYSILNNDPYLFFLYATASPGKDIKVVESLLFEEIENIRKAAPPEKEVQKAKNQIESSFIMGQDSIFLQAMKYGKFEMIGDWRYIDQYIEGIRKVRAEDLTKVAKKYFTEENRTVGILVPITTARSEE